MTEESYFSTPELAERYTEEKLRDILRYLEEKRNLEGTAPYIQFNEILKYKLRNQHTSN